MPITSTGLISGINVDSILSQIQAAEQKPITILQGRQSGYQSQISGLLALSSKLSTFAAVASSVNNPANFDTRTADVTKTVAGVSLLSATTGSTATNGSYTLNVYQLAQAQKQASQGFVDQNTTAVASGDGTFKFKVGSSGTEFSVTLSSATTLQGLRDAINSAGGSVTATIINDGTGSNPYRLVLTANASGGDNTITLTNNDSTLDFTNKKVEAAYASTTNSFGGTVSSNAGNNYTGTTNKTFLVKAVVGGAPATATYKYSIDGGITYLGYGGVAYNAAALTGTAGAGIVAASALTAIDGSGATNEGVQIGFGATGTLAVDDKFTVDVFNPQFQQAQDAVIKIDGNTITKSSNTITDAIQGVTLNLLQVDASNAVTLTISSDPSGLAEKIKNFTTAYNDVNKFLNDQFTFDPKVKKAGALLADASVRAVQSLLKRIVTGSIPGLTTGKSNLSQIGITSDSKTGVLSVDDSKLSAAISSDPEGVKRLFLGVGTATNSAISFVGLSPKTGAGTYGVTISVAPQKAVLGGASDAAFQDLSSTGLTNAEQLSFTFSSNYTAASPAITSFAVTLTAGSKINGIVSALNSAFATNKVGLSASNDSGRLKITSTDYGKDIRFTVVSDQAGTTQTGIGSVGGSVSRSFNGTNGYLDAGNSTTLAPTQMSFSLWFNPAAFPGATAYEDLLRKEDSYEVELVGTGFGESSSTLGVGIKTGTDPANFYTVNIPNAALSLNTWQHIALTADGSNVKVYLNGVQYGSSVPYSGSINNTAANHVFLGTFGTTSPSLDRWYNGNIDDVQIFNRALSLSEITQIKNDPTSVTSGQVAYWPLTGASPEPDTSGGNNATVSGATTSDGHTAASVGSGVVAQGVDVAGTINGHTATGNGNVLTSHSGFAEDGLSISTETTTTGLFGTIAVSRGVGDRLVASLDAYTNPLTGIFIGKTNSLQGSIDGISKNITQINDRITKEGDRLRAQFVNLETLLGKFQATSNFLTNQLAKLPTFSSTTSSPGGFLPS